MYQRSTLFRRCVTFVDVVSTSCTDVVSTLCKVENPMSDFVSFSTPDQRFFNVDPQRGNNVDPTLKYWLGLYRSNLTRRYLMKLFLERVSSDIFDWVLNTSPIFKLFKLSQPYALNESLFHIKTNF